MELALSLGETPKAFSFHDDDQKKSSSVEGKLQDLGFCMDGRLSELTESKRSRGSSSSSDPPPRPVQLDLLPLSPVQRTQPPPPSIPLPNNKFPLPWLINHKYCMGGRWPLEAKLRAEDTAVVDGTTTSSPNSTLNINTSSVSVDFSIFRRSCAGGMISDFKVSSVEAADGGGGGGGGGVSSRGSDRDEDDNNSCGGINNARKKLRLTKDQSVFLEQSFKLHNTLNPKQKVALAKQLSLRPRQVEVWFQNRRARTKLKQTEVDCEYLKRCCETLTEENRRLQKEVQELRALNKASQPFYNTHLPPTTLTMCPSCERVVTTAASDKPPKLFPPSSS